MHSDFHAVLRSPAKTLCIAALRLTLALGSLLATSGCALVTGYRIADGAKMPRSYRTVAGSVHVGRDAAINDAKTVAGEIRVAAGATTRSLGTVAGEIRIGERANIDGNVATVAGGIRIGEGSHVSGGVSSIAGDIELNGCHIAGPVSIKKGSLQSRGVTRISAGIVVHHADTPDNRNATRVDIGSGADVASVEVEADTKVELRISREARVGKITGVEPTYY